MLFDPFFTSKFAGRGLGLPVVLGILRTHGGAITFESELNRGSVFQVYLPLSLEHVPLHLNGAACSSAIGTRHAVLLVEDDRPMREMVETMLTRLGFVVFAAQDGIETVEIFREHQNDIRIVLCDLTMPGLDGWKTLGGLRTIAPGIPVIFISGHDESQVMQSDQPEYPQAFLQKPFKKQDLQRALDVFLNAYQNRT